MDDGKTALLFFYGLFWASALAAITEFRAFDTAAFWRSDTSHRALWRFLVGLLIANVLPLGGLWLLYSDNSVIPKGSGAGPVLGAALASLSVFCVPRFMHAFLATSLHSLFYSNNDWKEVVAEAKAKESDSFWAHFVPGVAYILVFIALAKVFTWRYGGA
jgi:hypothetical protein